MKTSHLLRVFSLLLVLAMLVASFAACTEGDDTPAASTTAASTENPYSHFFDAPEIKIDPNASIYNGTPDTSWYNGTAKEYTLTSAAQLVGFATLITKSCSFEGVTVKLGCDMIVNQGTSQSIQANAAACHKWPVPAADALFKGNFDGQGHVVSGVYLEATDSNSAMFGAASGTVDFKNLSVIHSYFAAPAAEGKEGMAVLFSSLVGDGSSLTFNDVNLYAEMGERGKSFSKVAYFLATINDAGTVSFNNVVTVGNLTITGTHAGSLIAHVNATKSTLKLGTCTNFANITADKYVGGMVGQSKSQNQKAVDCVNRGTLSANSYKGVVYGEKIVLNDIYEGARPEVPAGSTGIRVMSFNVLMTLPKSDGVLTPAAKNRIEAVRQEIFINDPDFIGMQEDNDTWHSNINLSEYNLLHFRQGLSSSAESCAIYYKKGIPLLDSGMAWLTSGRNGSGCALTMADLTTPGSYYYMTPEELAIIDVDPADGDKSIYEKKYQYVDKETGETKQYSSGYSMMSTRKMTWGVFDINGQSVIYINTHLNHRSQNAEYSNDTYLKIRSFERVKEFHYLQQTLAEILKKYPNSPVFMTGDWNDVWPSEICEVVMAAGYRSAHVSAPADQILGVPGSWNSCFNASKYGDNYPSSNEGKASTYLDYCFVSSDIDVLRFIHGEGKAKITLKDGTEKYIYTADHRPIITDICFKTPESGPITDGGSGGSVEDDLTKPSAYQGVSDVAWYDGSKTEYTLTTAAEFMGFLKLRQEGGGSLTFDGVTIKLGRDLIFNEGTAAEIAALENAYSIMALNSGYQFKGIFDGQGHTIYGVHMKCTTSAVKGMFGGLGEGAVIKNLTLEHCYVGGPTEEKNTLGVLAARVSGTNVLISNVKVKDALMLEDTGTFNGVGALIGRVDASGAVTIENCETDGTIDFSTKGTQCGGFLGYIISGGKATFTNCKSSVSIKATDYCGGLIGKAEETAVTIDSATAYTGVITTSGSNKSNTFN